MFDLLSDALAANLSTEEKEQFFLLLTENIDLIEKIIPGAPLVNLVKNNIVFDHPIVTDYFAWRIKR